MDVTDANPFGRPPRRPEPPRPDPDEAAEAEKPQAATVWPWRKEQPDMHRLISRPVMLERQISQYQVVRLGQDIRDEAHYAVTAQANIDSRNAMAVILPGLI